MLCLHITLMRYKCQFRVIRGTFVMKLNTSGYGSQQIVSVRDICDVRGACFWLSKNLPRMPQITLYSQRNVEFATERVDSCWFVMVRNRAWQHSRCIHGGFWRPIHSVSIYIPYSTLLPPLPSWPPPPPQHLLYFHLLSPTWRSFYWLFTLFSLIIAHLAIFWH